MSVSRQDNTERNARILDLARQGKPPAEIARELGISRGVVSGVLRRARDSGVLNKAEPSRTAERHEPAPEPTIGEEASQDQGRKVRGAAEPDFLNALPGDVP
ncbi:MAG: helix-turn-helix domain-containing protein [Gemmataceae bacterium]